MEEKGANVRRKSEKRKPPRARREKILNYRKWPRRPYRNSMNCVRYRNVIRTSPGGAHTHFHTHTLSHTHVRVPSQEKGTQKKGYRALAHTHTLSLSLSTSLSLDLSLDLSLCILVRTSTPLKMRLFCDEKYDCTKLFCLLCWGYHCR